MSKRKYMIATATGLWRYKVYRKETFLGIPYWDEIGRTDYLEKARAIVREDMKMPIYITEGEE